MVFDAYNSYQCLIGYRGCGYWRLQVKVMFDWLQAGRMIQIYVPSLEAYLVAEGLFDDNAFTEDGINILLV